MIDFVHGTLNSESQLEIAVPLTPQQQLALSQSVIHGLCLLRVKTGPKHGSASFDITGIEVSFYDPWNTDGSDGIVYTIKSFTAVQVSTGDAEHAFVDLSSIKELGIYPTVLKLQISTTNTSLSAGNYFEGVHIGIVMANASR